VPQPWNAAALPKIMAGALQEGKRGESERSTKPEQQARNLVAPPVLERIDRKAKAMLGNRGLTPLSPNQGVSWEEGFLIK